MRVSKRLAGAALAALGLGLAAVVAFDVYEDWVLEGAPLGFTVLENAVPLTLAVGIAVVAGWLVRTHDRAVVVTVSRWSLVGMVAILGIAASAFALQTLQGRIKPAILLTHTAIGGASAGVFMGYVVADLQQTRTRADKQRRRRESLFANAPSAMADLRRVGDDVQITSTNEAFRSWFVEESESAVGQSLFAVVNEDDATRAKLLDHLESDEIYVTETPQWYEDRRRHYKLRFVPYSLAEGDVRAYAVYSDVTDLKETERRLQTTVAELEQSTQQLERSNEQLKQFAYVASHDLQEPLRMVSSYVDLLADEYGDELDEDADEYIEYAVDGATRMQAMIDALLEYSRVQTQGEELSPTDAGAVLERTLQDLAMLIDDAGASVSHEDLPTVRADPSQLGQVFQNLIKNAIEHAGEEPPSIHVGVAERADTYVFSVADDGVGIPEDQQEKVFEIFQRGSREGDGTGIGLAVCERILSRHEGDIWVDSTAGEGATFHFSLPKTEGEH